MEQNSFHLMVLFAATTGVAFIPLIGGLIAVLLDRD